jgi:hypothetical protein
LAVLPLFCLVLDGCASSTPSSPSPVVGDWFRCKAGDCTTLDNTGVRFGDDGTWQTLHQLGTPDYSADLQYCLGRGQDDAGTYAWDGVALKASDGLGRDVVAGTVAFPDPQTMQITDASGRVVLLQRIRPPRLSGPCN